MPHAKDKPAETEAQQQPAATTDTSAGKVEVEQSTAPEGNRLSQEQVDEIVKHAKAKERRATEKRIRQELEGKAKDAKPTESESDGLADRLVKLEQELARSKADNAFSDHVSELTLTKDQRAFLRDLWDPEDPEKIDRAVKTFGLGKPAEQKAAPAGAPGHVSRPADPSPGGANPPPSGDNEIDATKWSRDYVERLRSDGSFLKKIDEFRASLPGGSSGLFRKSIPKPS